MYKVCVLSGSPKGERSVTYQTVLFLQQNFTDCEFRTLHVGQLIRKYEKDLTEAIEALEWADCILFCYPVYTFMAPCQLHRFIELLKEQQVDVSQKHAVQITTSKHFYDVTAHKFIQENCEDLQMRYLGGLSADMDDLLQQQGRKQALDFWKLVMWRAQNGISMPREEKCTSRQLEYQRQCFDNMYEEAEDKKANQPNVNEREIVIVANLEQQDTSLANMIADFQTLMPYKTRVVNVAEYAFKGGCLGCFHCVASAKCIYDDGFDEFLRTQILTADAIIYAFTIKDHSMGSRMKMYDDRQFCNGHRTMTAGRPIGYLVNGDLSQEKNLSMIMEARAEVGKNFLAGIATDEMQIEEMVLSLEYALENALQLPQTFWGIGGAKIFRDLIWQMRGMMKADHRFYKKHGMYDFPQKKKGSALAMMLVGFLVSNPKIMNRMGTAMLDGMVAPYKKVLEKDAKALDKR